jgi:ADP-heptose:LPS heptosyltransferase
VSNHLEPRLLIIRFSSFGDIVQAVGVPAAFLSTYRGARVDWLVREDYANLLRSQPLISSVISFERKLGFLGLVALSWRLARDNYTHVYDAHSNIRSRIVVLVFRAQRYLSLLVSSGQKRQSLKICRRSKERLARWLFFRFRAKTLPQPYKGAESFIRPLAKWQIPVSLPPGPLFSYNAKLPDKVQALLTPLPRPRIALAPSAAWQMKRWPIEHWKRLIELLHGVHFVVLGGPEDGFLGDIAASASDRVVNLAGKVSLLENALILQQVDLVVANDTGILHVADQMERPTLALIGPTAFGYPSHMSSQILEIELACKPCSKDGSGRCKNSLYQRCLVELTPERVAAQAKSVLENVRHGQ